MKETVELLVFAEVDLFFSRAIINMVFPLYILLALWLVVLAETLVYYPYYVSVKNVDNSGIVMGAVGILFALPNVRNTMPDAPDIGAIIDYAAYFWCLVLAISHLLFSAILWVRFTVVFAKSEEVLRKEKEEAARKAMMMEEEEAKKKQQQEEEEEEEEANNVQAVVKAIPEINCNKVETI